MAFIAVAGASLFGGGAFGSLAFNAVLGLGMLGVSAWLQSRQKIKGPRLEDLGIGKMSTGSVIPWHMGQGAMYGVPIWIKDNKLIEKSKTKRQGKGGPKVTTYSYYVTGAWAICDNEIVTIQKWWVNDKLIYNTVDVDKKLKVKNLTFNIYKGTETQMPDHYMEAALGAGNAPAYRGVSYVVVNELPLEDFGNTIPQMRFQMITAGSVNSTTLNITPSGHILTGYAPDYNFNRIAISNDRIINIHDVLTGELVLSIDTTLVIPSTSGIQHLSLAIDQFSNVYAIPNAVDDNGRTVIAVFDGETGAYNGTRPKGFSLFTYQMTFVLDSHNVGWLITFSLFTTHIQQTVKDEQLIYDSWSIAGMLSKDCITMDDKSRAWTWENHTGVYCTTLMSAGLSMRQFVAAIGGINQQKAFGYFPDEDVIVIVREHPTEARKFLVEKYNANPDNFTLVDSATVNMGIHALSNAPNMQHVGIREGYFCIGSVDTSPMIKFNLVTMQIEAQITPTSSIIPYNLQYFPEYDAIFWHDGDKNHPAKIGFFGRYAGAALTLKDMVDDLGRRVQMPEARQNTSALSSIPLRGYTIEDATAAADALNDVMTVTGVDVADVGAYNKFVIRGTQTPITISSEDLGVEEGPEPAEASVTIEVEEEYSIPKVINLKHIDPDAKFEISVQQTFRHSAVVYSVDESTLNTRLVLTANEAASYVTRLLAAMWRGRTSFKIQLPPKYKKLAPADVINIPYNGSYRQAIISQVSPDGVVQVEAVKEDITKWSTQVIGQSTKVKDDSIYDIPQVRMILLDGNALRDEDVDDKFYLAFYPYGSNIFTGVSVMKGSSASTLEAWLAFTDRVTRGIVTVPPNNVSYPELIDRSNRIRVYIPHSTDLFTFTAATEEDLWNNASLNPMIIMVQLTDGSYEAEYMQFGTAVQVSPDTWEFHDVIRGCRGTEHLVGLHKTGAIALFPTANNMYREGETAEVGLPRVFQAIHFGGSIPSSEPTETFTNTGKAQRPYSPWNFSGKRNYSTGSLTFNWVRRAKKNGGWVEDTEVPLDESSEQYKLRIWSNSAKTTLLRTETVTTTSFTYTVANYNADASAAISTVPTVYAEVTQVGAWGESVASKGTF